MPELQKDNIRYVLPLMDGIVATSQASGADGRTGLCLVQVRERITIKALITINGATVQDSYRIGIYKAGRTTGGDPTPLGGELIFDSGAIVQAGVNTAQKFTLNNGTLTPGGKELVLEPGLYYVGQMFTGTTMTYMRQSNQRNLFGQSYTFDNAGGFGAFPAVCPAVTESASAMSRVIMEGIIA